MARPSPVRLRCRPLFSESMVRHRNLDPDSPQAKRTICQWSCNPSAKVIRFASRDRPGLEAIVHPSAKRPGRWQLTWIEDDIGPTGDIQVATCTEAVRELSHKRWKLEEWMP